MRWSLARFSSPNCRQAARSCRTPTLGSWAPEYYTCKAHLTLAGSALVRVEDEVCRFDAGTVWTFDNLLMHDLENNGKCDRISGDHKHDAGGA